MRFLIQKWTCSCPVFHLKSFIKPPIHEKSHRTPSEGRSATLLLFILPLAWSPPTTHKDSLDWPTSPSLGPLHTSDPWPEGFRFLPVCRPHSRASLSLPDASLTLQEGFQRTLTSHCSSLNPLHETEFFPVATKLSSLKVKTVWVTLLFPVLA